MLVLIDESGCPGFKISQGSSSHFVIAMTIFKDLSQAEGASQEIGRLRERLCVKPEFKFSKTHPDIRDAFFEMITQFDFIVRGLVVDKPLLYSQHLRTKKESFYNFFVRNLLDHDGKHLNNAIIKIDGSGNKEFQQAMQNYLKNWLSDGKLKKFKFVNSRQDNLIQMADMVVGAIARSYKKDRKDHDKWFKMLKPKIDDIWSFH